MSPAEEMKHFLLVYDVALGEAVVEEFGTDYEAALEAYAQREREYRERGAIEADIVLVGADSLETVRKTHSSYFAVRSGQSAFDEFVPA